jgi:hypothetical protein
MADNITDIKEYLKVMNKTTYSDKVRSSSDEGIIYFLLTIGLTILAYLLIVLLIWVVCCIGECIKDRYKIHQINKLKRAKLREEFYNNLSMSDY